MDVEIRGATEADQAAVAACIASAFGAEAPEVLRMVVALGRTGAARASIVAVAGDQVIGHVGLSRGWIDARRELVDALILSPLSVAPEHQRLGIGSALITAALAVAGNQAAPAVFLEGDWRYYGVRGFSAATPLGFRAPSPRIPEPAFQVALLDGHEPWMTGPVVYPDGVWASDCAGLRDPRLQSVEDQVLAGAHSPLDVVTWPVSTERLTLRRGRADDAEAVYAYRSQESVSRWLTRVQNDPGAWRRNWLGRLPTSVVVEHQGRLIGETRIIVGAAHAQAEVADRALASEAELAWCFAPEAHGQGFATEAVRELVRIAFGQLGLRRLRATCYAENIPSWRLMERVGMRREVHTVASTLHRDGTWRDFLEYGLLAGESDLAG